jgi:hypothetical protein
VNDDVTSTDDLRALADDDLLRRMSELLAESRRVEWKLVAHIGEVDERKLYAREACESMFVYCRDVLHLSEHEAYLRIAAGRAAREHPMLLTMLADGRLHLSGIGKLAPHMTAENRDAVLARATHRTKEQIKVLVAELAPRPDVASSIRKLPERSSGPSDASSNDGMTTGRAAADGLTFHEPLASSTGPWMSAPSDARELGLDRVEAPSVATAPRAIVEPLSPGRFRVQFTASGEFCEKVQRLKAVLDSSVPDGDLARIFEIAISEALERREARRFGKTSKPRKTVADTDAAATGSRYIPLPVRRASYDRDGGTCRFVGANGRRCASNCRLHNHHGIPWAHGGDRSPANIALLCRTHNDYLAEIDYGKAAMERHRSRGAPKTGASDAQKTGAGGARRR